MNFVRPQILITPDSASASQENQTEYRLRSNYTDAIAQFGGLPLIVPHRLDCLEQFISCAHGLLVTGTLPGVQATHDRLAFEEQLIKLALKRDIPILGICHGMQLLGKCLGGHLLDVIPTSTNASINHNPQAVPDHAAHEIALSANSILNQSSRVIHVAVNSSHEHTLVGSGAFGVIAHSPDEVIEAISGETPTFCLGVQWHPEYQLIELDRQILKQFVAASALSARAQATNASR